MAGLIKNMHSTGHTKDHQAPPFKKSRGWGTILFALAGLILFIYVIGRWGLTRR